MKKQIIVSLICGIVLCCGAVYTFATTGTVNTDNLRLRKENSTSSDILTLISLGDKVEVISKTEDGWYKVKYKDYEGYVSAEYVDAKIEEIVENKNEEIEKQTQIVEEPISNITQNHEEVEQEINGTMILKNNQKIYGLPLINTSIITVVENETIAKVLTNINDWMYVSSDIYSGWVRREKIENENTNINNEQNNIEVKNIENNNENKNPVQEKIGYISGSDVNFRREPSTSGEIISTLTLNKEIVILERDNRWVKIKVNNEIGYVSATYISDTKVTTTSRGAASRKTVVSSNTTTNVPSNPDGSNIVEYAKQFLGCRYVYGGTTPEGFDCSGFTQYVFNHFGKSINRVSSAQANNGVEVNKLTMEPGDLICFSNSSGSSNIGHVGIYIGNGQFIHSANSRKGVIISNVDGAGFYYVCSRRII